MIEYFNVFREYGNGTFGSVLTTEGADDALQALFLFLGIGQGI